MFGHLLLVIISNVQTSQKTVSASSVLTLTILCFHTCKTTGGFGERERGGRERDCGFKNLGCHLKVAISDIHSQINLPPCSSVAT